MTQDVANESGRNKPAGEQGQAVPEQLARELFCYLTTTGRVTGKPHEIEISFGVEGGSLYLLSERGWKSDWVKNIKKNSNVRVRIGDRTFDTTAQIIEDGGQNLAVRQLLARKYEKWREGMPLSDWAREGLMVAIHLEKEHPS